MDTKINMSGKKNPDHGIFPCSRKMFRLRRLLLSGLILPLVLFIFSSQIQAMRLHQPFKQIVKDADLIFVGTVVHQEAQWGDGMKMIFTHVHFAVNEIICDQTEDLISEGQELILPFAGGQIDDQGMSVSDVPVFQENKSYVIFARLDGKRYASPTVGGFQGVFRVLDDEMTDQRYPLTASGHAISSVSRGELMPASAPIQIRSGFMEIRDDRRRERRRDIAPQPAMAMGPARAEVATSDASASVKIITLAQFFDEIRKQIDAADKEVAP